MIYQTSGDAQVRSDLASLFLFCKNGGLSHLKTKPANLLFIFSDQHKREMLGHSGHSVVRTPNLDQLCQQGVHFTNAYTNCPICVPARASLATGRYVNEIGAWDNAAPYTGTNPSWGHRLTEQGYQVTTVGKLHYRDDSDDTGFPDKRLSLNVLNGIGDVYSLIRERNMPVKGSGRARLLEAGAGESSYTKYDCAITQEAMKFLREEAHSHEKPWVLFVSYVSPHFPLIAPQEYYDQYPLDSIEIPRQYDLKNRPIHPAIEEYRRVNGLADELDDNTVRKAIAAYYGLCSFLDAQIGEVLSVLRESGLDESTNIIYTSDHGDTMGEHGVWFKSTMYEGSAGIPFIMAGPDLPKGKTVEQNISLVDCFPTILESVGAELTEEDRDIPGISLFPLAKGEAVPQRTIFSEYHASSSLTGVFMIRDDRYKYVHYIDYPPQLFDLKEDPHELDDKASNPDYVNVMQACEAKLRGIVNPEMVNANAKEDQQVRLEKHGGREHILAQGFKIPYTPAPGQFQQ
jgi:choline-sulfatase